MPPGRAQRRTIPLVAAFYVAPIERRRRSAHMLADDAGELEHGDLRPSEDGQEQRIGVDRPLVDRVLQAVRLDVIPQLFDYLRAGNRLVADDGRKLLARGQRLA